MRFNLHDKKRGAKLRLSEKPNIIITMTTQEIDTLASELAAKAGKPLSRFFYNAARHTLKARNLAAHGGVSTRKGDAITADMKREYRTDRF